MSTHGLIVSFYLDSVHMVFKSEEAGRPIYEDRDHIRILIPGDRNSVIERIASDDDKKKYATEYASYKAGKDENEQMVGTPLRQWPAMRPAMVKEMEAMNIRTVEQLADLSDAGMQNFGPGSREWKAKAAAYLGVAAGSAAAEKVAAENESLKNRIADLEAQIASLAARFDGEKRGPGRPRNNQDVAA